MMATRDTSENEALVDPKAPVSSKATAVAVERSNSALPTAEPELLPPATSAPGGAEAPALSADEAEALRTKAAKADENWDRYLRAVADLENYKKRATRERAEATKYANESLLSKLVPILDTFDLALAAANASVGAGDQSLKTGVAMINGQLRAALVEAGLEEIEALGKPFDPNWHEAISQQESSETPEGHVLQQVRKGYRFRDRLLRPAAVIVAKRPAT